VSRLSGLTSLDRPIATGLVVHFIARLAAVLAVVIACAIHPLGTGSLGGDLGAALGKSDGVWYLGIAHHGYGPPPPIGPHGVYTHLTSLAFFPLYPLLIRAVAFTGLPYLGAALVVTALAGAVAAVAIVQWARPVVGDRGAVMLLGSWELLPSSIVLSMAYAEGLFVAAAACCLLALQRRRWLLGGLAAGIGGLTRPTGGCLVLAVAVAAAVEIRRHRRAASRTAASEGVPMVRLVGALALAVTGLAASLLHVAAVTDRLDGWFWLERTVWNSGFDAGWSALNSLGQLVTGGRPAHRLPEIVAAVMVVAVVVVAVWFRSSRVRPDPPAAAYSIAVAVLAVGERGYFYVKPRLLFVAFPALAPLAAGIAAQPRRRLVLVGIPVALLSLAYNAYLLVGWWRAL
jgi:hypothetical protein